MIVAMNTLNSSKPPLVVIVGPTASRKTALALELADRTPSTIINMDASQVYADLPILSAQPSAIEQASAPHRLFGYVDGATSCSAAHWAADARKAIAESRAMTCLPILVGGTGLYLRTLLDGIAPVPDIEPKIRAAVRELPVAEAHAALRIEDPAAAMRLAAADTARVARALEVVRATGQTLAEWQAARVGGIGTEVYIVPLILLPPRDWLVARCDERFDAMMAHGAVDEVAAILARGLDPALPVMRAIGVREIAAMLAGSLSKPDAISAAQIATRQYAKRQYTWFRNQCPITWLRIEETLNHHLIHNLAIKLHKQALTV